MSAIKKSIENDVTRIAKESGYSWDFIMDKFNEVLEKGSGISVLASIEKAAINHIF